jgi:hypothetical protein
VHAAAAPSAPTLNSWKKSNNTNKHHSTAPEWLTGMKNHHKKPFIFSTKMTWKHQFGRLIKFNGNWLATRIEHENYHNDARRTTTFDKFNWVATSLTRA